MHRKRIDADGGMITNKADFQRVLNGSERRVNDLRKLLDEVDKVAPKLLLVGRRSSDASAYFDQLNGVARKIHFLDHSLASLNESPFAANWQTRMTILRTNVEKNRQKFEKMKQYARIKYGYDYQVDDSANDGDSDNEQYSRLIQSTAPDEATELDVLKQRTLTMSTLEDDLHGIHEAFKDIRNLVDQQGSMINTIEAELTTVDIKVSKANNEVKKTLVVKRRTSRVRCVVLAVVISVCVLVLLIVYLTLRFTSPFRFV